MVALARLALIAAVLSAASQARAADWNTAPSYYTHDPNTAERVSQYSPIGPFYVYTPPDYVRSGFRHTRSTVQAGGSADNVHIVEEWGRPVQPYEQWRFNNRPYGDNPYPAWGPPFAGATFVPGFGWGPGGGIGPGGPGGPGGNASPYYQMQGPAPWLDGYYPSYDSNDRSPYYEPYPSRRRGGHGGGGGDHGGAPSNGASPYYQMQGPAPWLDGYYPSYDSNDRSRYYEPYLSRRRGGHGSW